MVHDVPNARIAGPLHEWLLSVQRPRRPRPRRIPVRTAKAAARGCETYRPMPSKRLFLLELECLGAMPAAAQKSGCTLAEVRTWRAADPKFDRDVLFAAARYLRTLENMLAEAAATLSERRATDVWALLDAKPGFRGADGRLDAAAWRDALRRSAAELNLDLSSWEPRDPEDDK